MTALLATTCFRLSAQIREHLVPHAGQDRDAYNSAGEWFA